MDREGLRAGHLLALSGAGLLLLALWLPWYSLSLGPAERGRLSGGAAQFGGASFAALADGLLARLDGLRLTAWAVFGGTDVMLAVAAGIVVVVVLAAAGAAGPGVRIDHDVAARIALAIGVVAVGLILLRAVDRPGPAGILDPGPGIWVGLAGASLIAVGGALGRGQDRALPQSVWAAPAPAAPLSPGRPGSTPPPGMRAAPDA
ncbi:hypothetical protein DSM112329_02529 [Paraconexibacter sp. AEG42_29]|uniref:DUF998 domain-containing protein n=1 Tax=Paraconexibacter sp. AEG42_29 TaxID=2997339 RepID=A0AAU7AVK6_9ACTN